MATKYILAIDHGTSGAKTAIVSTQGAVVDWVFQEVPLHLSEGGCAEQDPADWWNAIKITTKKLIEKKLVPVEDIVGICNTSQWSGMIPLDEQGNCLMRCLIWMDTRAAEITQKTFRGTLNVSGYGARNILAWLKRTGGAPSLSGKDSISKILWLKEKHPEIYNSTRVFLEPQDYVNFKFTGKIAASYASIHLHWLTDVRKKKIKYSKKLIRRLKLDPNKFPELMKSTDVLGTITEEVALELGLNPRTEVVMGAPDIQSAAIGSGAIEDYKGHICLGTSDWIFCHIPNKHTDIFNNLGTTPSGIDGKFLYGNDQEIAGGALTFLRDNILYHMDLLLLEQYKERLNEAFKNLVKEISQIESVSKEDIEFIKQRLMNYEAELQESREICNLSDAFDKIGSDLAKESKITGKALDYLKSQYIKYKDEVLKEAPLKDVIKIFDKLAASTPPGSNKLIFTPWLYGERSPIADEFIRGGFYNVSLDTNRGDLVRAVLEGVAYNIRWLVESTEKYIKKLLLKQNRKLRTLERAFDELPIIGGGAQSDIWCQIIADVLNIRIKRVKNPIQANARGAAFIGAVGLEYLRWQDIPDLVEFSDVFKPSLENREIYDFLFEQFKTIYKINHKLYKTLNLQ
ncbi:MAG: hypothetical protein JW891_05855 [Candidatus Lokiarchaeota archaeon]|nr:hypothetical protein [Candidatus Lokiarchaeota archaeon]